MKHLILVPILALLISNASACVDHELPEASASVEIAEASVSTTKNNGPLFVTVLGALKNTTNNKIDNLVLEAKLTDANGKVVDVLTEHVYGLVVPASQQVAFRLQAPAAASPNSYAGVQVRVVSAEAHAPSVPRAAKKETSRIIDWLVSWGPMILLIVVWVFLARKYSGKGSVQDKMLVALGEQNSLIARQISAIESIATAANAKKSASDA